MQEKVMTLEAGGKLLQDGDLVALGGNTLHRSPSAFVRELARQGKRDLKVVKTAGAYDIDLLCAAGVVSEVYAGYVGFENLFGLAPHYRKAVEEGRVRVWEHACYTVIAGLRAAAYGIPFQPVAGLEGSEVPRVSGFKRVTDPYSGREVFAIPPIAPDWAVIHVQEADRFGNGKILGSPFEDVLMTRAARGVILTTEKIVSPEELRQVPELIVIPHFLVQAVIEVPGGASPCSCYPYYDLDREEIGRYLTLADDPEKLGRYLKEKSDADRRG
ncbi:MAG: CoA transferase subunit A [Nitrospinota bacterium]|nr:MAG: CoA transferase subunit A [Nitrospinota bacterium]